jgi:hypothetical protein
MSRAIIQPSKFEGWSTVIEDAKALNKFVLASNIPVHSEQIKKNVDFFDTENEQQLADKIISLFINKPVIQHHAYADDIRRFGELFLKVVTSTAV